MTKLATFLLAEITVNQTAKSQSVLTENWQVNNIFASLFFHPSL